MKSNFKGFTLLELVVVLVILGLAATLVFVNVGKSYSDKKHKIFVTKLVSLCKRARRVAMDKGEPSQVRISSEQRRCWIEGKKGSLFVPEDMRVEGEHVAQIEDGIYGIIFYADGSSSGGILTFSVDEEPFYKFKVDVLTGAITVLPANG